MQVLLQFVIGVRAADDHQRWPGITHLNLFTHAALFFPGFAFGGAIHHVQHRGIDHTQHRFAILNQGNVDGEFTITFDELLGAVQRINQPVTLPVLALFPRLRIFF